ncbi:MAG: N-acetylmuramic acid 6-phosphate etherase [Nitrospinota bacterium]
MGARRPRGKGGPSGWARLPTEKVHPSSQDLDCKTPAEILRLMEAEDCRAVHAVYRESTRIQRAAAKMARALGAGGRVIFMGAGTSGRLGVLEAAECPPTFGTAPWQIQAVVAGGRPAVFRAREGAEDRRADARAALRDKRLGAQDLVVGISASSVTPFVRSGLAYARKLGVGTVLITCGPRVRGLADLLIAPAVGSEILAGSTRLKAGTATKLVLNAMTMLAMVRLGKVYGPFMVDLRRGSAKLRDRARRIVAAAAGVSPRRASRLLAQARGDVKTAIVAGKLGVSVREAKGRLAETGGHLRAALEL